MQKWYWSKNKMIATPFFGTVMPEYRFSLIMKYLHLANNEEFDETAHPAPKLKKIWEVSQMILQNFQQTYVPERDVSIDESLMAYKGKAQLVAVHCVKEGTIWRENVYTVSLSLSGYICIWLCPYPYLATSGIPYTGKGTQFNPRYSHYGLATSSVLTLTEPLLDQGYCVTTDNFYTSPELYEFLLQHRTDAYGTIRLTGASLFAKGKLKTREIVAWQKGKMMALGWCDKKDVCLKSTVHDAFTVLVHTKCGKEVMKPQVVIDYNNTMGGVDRADQAMTFYPVMRKRQRK
ncbi:cdc42 effector protein 2 isoform X1 [Pyxicephalus adspersus]|uniref:cdc42 effector protein 2 isoform X1 n=1 Tax=Pyxicephalus adspersus TaxID=30357 RepID=UPI003B5B4506